MREWRPLHRGIITSDKLGVVGDAAFRLFMYLLVAQDDDGNYPWTRIKRNTLTVGTGWGDGNLILFELLQTQGDVRLKITLGPGDAGVREHIAEHISGQSAVFSRADKKISSTWWGFHTTAGWIPKLTYQEADEDELRERLGAKLAEFVRDDLPAMVDALQPLSATDWDALSSSPSTES